MRKAIYTLSAFAVALVIASCTKDIEGDVTHQVKMQFKAVTESYGDMPETKTILGGSFSDNVRQILWNPGDKIALSDGKTMAEFVNIERESSEEAVFDGTMSAVGPYMAVFPYGIAKGATSNSFTLYLPDKQSYVEDNFAQEAFPMVAKITQRTTAFKNLCGILVLRLTGDKTLKSITFTGFDANGKAMGVAGECVVNMDYESVPQLVMAQSAKTAVTLDCGNGVRLSESDPAFFYIILPAATYSTFTLVMECTDGSVYYKSGVKPLTIERSKRVATASFTYAPFIDLSGDGTANSYIVSQPGCYKIPAVKGNSSEQVGSVASAEVLWESFGTDQAPAVGDLVRGVSYADGYVNFQASSLKGNAVIAAKDASGTILWSWHIWMTDQPEDQVYKNGAGTMMDRNLGATSATPGDVHALGLMYQWGRKDPFLGPDNIKSFSFAKATHQRPQSVHTDQTTGSIEYTITHPMQFVTYNDLNYDWFYTGDASVDNSRWMDQKTIYDPCPIGYRLPDGGEKGIWSTAFGKSSDFNIPDLWDFTSNGIDFSELFGTSGVCWYPALGYLHYHNGLLASVDELGYYWSCTPPSNNSYCSFHAHRFRFSKEGDISPSGTLDRADARPVRCYKENSATGASAAVDLSSEGTANSYIVSESGTYKLKTVKGSSSESVGAVASAEVLWESFGNDQTPNVGDLVDGVRYDNGYIAFRASSLKGNAVIAAKDASGTILWSWHIWMTDQPEDQVYNNGAGTMMDRNLGATSATPGDVQALGLLYQWGRKDPFLTGRSISTSIPAASSIAWPEKVPTTSQTGTIEYSLANPTTLIIPSGSWNDWCHDGALANPEDRWTRYSAAKSIYDPCPAGYRVPEGGEDGVWTKAFGLSEYGSWDASHLGYIFTTLSSGNSVWYPASGTISMSGQLGRVGTNGGCWGTNISSNRAGELYYGNNGSVTPSNSYYFANSTSVRCIKESSMSTSSREFKAYFYMKSTTKVALTKDLDYVWNGLETIELSDGTNQESTMVDVMYYGKTNATIRTKSITGTRVIAALPHSNIENGVVGMSVPYRQGSSFDNKMMAAALADGDNVLPFSVLNAFLSVAVSEPVDSILVTVESGAIAGPLTAEYNSGVWDVRPEGDRSYVKICEAVSSEVFVAILPGAYDGMTITFYKDGKIASRKSTSHFSIAPNSVIAVPAYTFTFENPAASDLSAVGTANSYIVPQGGRYKFKTVKGNSNESVGNVKSVEVLWESYGTSEKPIIGSLLHDASYADGYISFNATNRKGNAVIAAKDASGTILWSWHIWMTDQPEDQVYNNGAGTMMDRNLGATSATPGDVKAQGLMYQWGRKDPFLGAINRTTKANSSIVWPSPVASNATNGTLDYSTKHPTTFITSNGSNYDWHYSGSSETDHTRWQSKKTLHDPCPVGYCIPEGGESGLWFYAFGGRFVSWETESNWNSSYKGMNFGVTDMRLGNSPVIWYPAAGTLSEWDSTLQDVYSEGNYWTCTPYDANKSYMFRFSSQSIIQLNARNAHGEALSVRCCKENSSIDLPTVTTATVTNVTATSATCGGNVTSAGGASVTARGVVWSTSSTPTVDLSTKTTNGSGTGSFSASITGLQSNTTYYVRAYATNAAGTVYGSEISFTTKSSGTGEGIGNGDFNW